jgi:hypothetical protein
MDKLTAQEHIEEKREYPRIVLESPVNILYKIHQLQAKIHDISPDGLQIRADSESLKKINPDNEEFTEKNSPLLDVTFCLKLYEMDMRLNALCRISYTNPLPETENKDVVYGLKFVNFEGSGFSQLEAYITHEMSTF